MDTTKLEKPVLPGQKQNKVNTAKIIFYLFTLIFILVSCNTTQPPPPGSNGTIQLTVEDVSSTEVWLNIKTQNITLPAELKLFREDSVTQIFNLPDRQAGLRSPDTLLYNNNLQPNQTYNYKATYTGGGQTIQSQTVTATTMDTTSHNFTWQTYTFGGVHGSSVLNDVAIINENNIWAVGEIHTADDFDSTGNYLGPYNAIHWDGQGWELKRINGHSSPINTILAFNQNDIWFDGLLHWDGNNYSLHSENFPLEPNGDGWRINSMWGTSSSDFYVVGNNGNIAHYNGSRWHKIESGTGSGIQDIWGVNNIISSGKELYITVPTQYSIYKIDEQNNIKRLEIGDNRFFRGIWTKNGLKVYVSGFGMVSGVSGKWTVEVEGNQLFYKDVKGDGSNNIVAAGGNGEVAVFNGIRWVRYNEITNNNILYEKVAVKKDIVAAVGETFGNEIVGTILIGHRN